MRRLTIERAAEIILFALIFALAVRIPVDTDLWWHLRSGQYTLSNGIIYNDPFSFTFAGQYRVSYEWLSQVIMYLIWQVSGNVGMAFYTAGLATAGMVVIYRMSAGNVYLKSFALVIGAATAAVFWSPRPAMVTFFLSTVILYLIFLYKNKGVDRLWWIPPIMALWANLHTGYAIAFIFLLTTILGETLSHVFGANERTISWRGIRKLVLITLVSLAAMLLNPYGLDLLLVPLRTVGIAALREFVNEWNSPNFHDRATWPFLLLLLGTLGAVWASKKRFGWTEFGLLSATFFLSLFAGRNIPMFAVAATPILTEHLDNVLTERGWRLQSIKYATPTMARLNAVLVVIILLGALAKIVIVLEPKLVRDSQSLFLPVEAVEHLNATQPPGPMFNSYNWGGYLLFFAPQYPVFIDGRTDLYREFVLDYLRTARGGDGWREMLDEYGINLVVVENGSGLDGHLRDEIGWRLDYEDALAVIYVREDADV